MTRILRSPLWYRVAGLRPRLRPHVRITRQAFRGAPWFVAEDGAHNRFHRFTPASHAAIALMDGTRTVEEIWLALEALQDQRPTQDELIHLLAQLDAADLLATAVRPDFAQLAHRARRDRGRKLMGKLLTPLYLRIKLFDPDRFLTATAPLLRPLASPWGALLWLVVVGWGAAQAALHWTALTHDLADRVLAADNAPILLLTFPLLKVLHELGHGYAAKLGGGAVHEAGVMTLIFLPVPYVDVSSSLGFRGRWHRALVAAAGMMVEVFVAAIAMVVWANAEPGIARAAAFNVMLIAGVSTLVFNGNPLLRFDAYYILSDLIEVPNLAARANRWYGYLVNRYAFGLPDQSSPVAARGEAAWFAVYAPASYVYRLTVMASVALFVAASLHGVGAALAIWTVGVGVLLPVVKGLWYLATGPALRTRRVRAFAVTAASAGAVAALLFAVPLPYGTVTQGVIAAPPETDVRAGAEGTLASLDVPPGAPVEAGTRVATLRDPLLEARVRLLEAQWQEIRLRWFAAQDRDQTQARMLLEQVRYFASELADARRRRDDLAAVSAVSGRLLLAENARDLPGRYLRRGELIGRVVDGRAAVIRVVVPQSEIELVRQDVRRVDIRLASDPLTVHRAPGIAREVPTATRELPSAALSVPGGGTVSVDPADEKHLRAVEMLFELEVALPDGVSPERIGERVHVRLDHGTRTLGWRAARLVRQTFLRRFDL